MLRSQALAFKNYVDVSSFSYPFLPFVKSLCRRWPETQVLSLEKVKDSVLEGRQWIRAASRGLSQPSRCLVEPRLAGAVQPLACGAGSPQLSCLTRVEPCWDSRSEHLVVLLLFWKRVSASKPFPCVNLFFLLRNATCPKSELRGYQPDASSVCLWNAVSFKSQKIFAEVQHYLNKWLKIQNLTAWKDAYNEEEKNCHLVSE